MIRIPGTIPITIHPIFWLLAALIGWINSASILGTAIWVGVIVLSVLVHEFGHALTAIAFGQRAEIELMGLGGLTRRSGRRLKLWQEFLIVLNGPFAGMLLFVLAFHAIQFIGDAFVVLKYTVTITAYANLFWTVLNLLPVQPLDGGRLLSIVLEGIFGFRGVKISLFFSLLLAVALSVLFFALRALLIGIIFLLIAFESYRAWRGVLSMTDRDQDTDLQDLFRSAKEDLFQGNRQKAWEKLQHIREGTKRGFLHLAATEQVAHMFREEGRLQEAYELLFPLQKEITPDSLRLLHELAYHMKHYETAIQLANQVFQHHPTHETALLNALCHVALGQTQPAIGWLQRAIQEGLPNLREVLLKEEFHAIRSHSDFPKVEDV